MEKHVGDQFKTPLNHDKHNKRHETTHLKLERERQLAREQLKVQRELNKSMLHVDKTDKNSQAFYKNMSMLSDSLRTGTDSIKDLCEQYSISTLSQSLDFTKEEFVPAEYLEDKLNADEMSWRKQFDMPKEREDFSQLSTADPNKSMGNYFLQKCQNLSSLSLQKSPQVHQHVKLIDSTIEEVPEKDVSNVKDDSVLSMSKLERMLHDSNDTSGRLFDMLLGKRKEPEQLEVSSFTPKVNSTLSSLQEAEENKENVKQSPNTSQMSNKDKSIVSTRSGSSLNTFPDGKIPIVASKPELIWGNLKIGKQQQQELIIKNKCSKRIYFAMNLTGSSFRILKDSSVSEYLTSINVLMHPLETKTFNIRFNPVSVGACVEKINFTTTKTEAKSERKIKLYGYGGCIDITFDGVLKDSINRLWLSLGPVNNSSLRKELVIKNSGNLHAFALLNIVTKDLDYLTQPQIITPRCIVIPPNKTAKVIVDYNPTRSDFEYFGKIQKEVIEVGNLKVIYGSETTRGRIRRLCNKLLKINSNVNPLVVKLSETITNESMPNDLNKFTESTAGLGDLLKDLNEAEITLTIEHNLDKTLIPNFNESTMFQSLLDGDNNETVLENTVLNKPPQFFFDIEPRTIILMPPRKCEDVIVLTSHFNKPVNYDVKFESSNAISVKPTEGVIRPNDTVLFIVSYQNKKCDLDNFNLFVNVHNDCVDVNVKLLKSKTM